MHYFVPRFVTNELKWLGEKRNGGHMVSIFPSGESSEVNISVQLDK